MSIKNIIMTAAGNIISLIKGSWVWKVTTNTPTIENIAADSTGNSYFTGYMSPSYFVTFIVKLDPLGNVLWKSLIGNSASYSTRGKAVTYTSTGEVFVGGLTQISTPIQKAMLVKLDVSGNLLWQRNFYANSTCEITNIIYANSNVYAVGNFSSLKFVICFNDSGTLQWKTILSYNGTVNKGTDLVLDTANNIYVVGTTNMSANYYGVITKINSAGTVVWSKKLSQASYFNSVSIDSSNSLIIAGTAGNSQLVIKLDSNGTILWQKISNAASYNSLYSVNVDTSGDIYAVGSLASPNYYSGFLVKFNSAGVVQWQKKITNNPVPTNIQQSLKDISLISGDSFLATVQHETSMEVLRLPIDGTKVGAYTNLIYTTITDLTYSSSAYSFSDSNAVTVNLPSFSTYFLDSSESTSAQYSNYQAFGFELSNGNTVTMSAGYLNSVSSYSTLIICRDSAGTAIWNLYFTSSTVSYTPKYILKDSSNNTYIPYKRGNGAFGVAKYNSAGVLQWSQDSTSFTYVEIAIGSDGNVYMTGAITSSVFRLVKFSSSGVVQWERQFAANNWCEAKALQIDSSGNIYVTGTYSTTGAANSYHVFLVKYNSAGVLQWQKYIYSSVNDTVFGLVIDSSNNVYFSGRVNNTNLIIKFDSSGNKSWGTTTSITASTILNLAIVANNLVLSAYISSTEVDIIALNPANGTVTSKFALDKMNVGSLYSDADILYIHGNIIQNSSGVNTACMIKSSLVLSGSVSLANSQVLTIGAATNTLTFTGSSSELISAGAISLTSPANSTYTANTVPFNNTGTMGTYARKFISIPYTEDSTAATTSVYSVSPSLTTIP